MNKGTLVVVSGFSGAGKGTVLSQVFQRRPDLYFSVSFTTRAPRTGEQDGVDYHFITREAFEERIHRGEFLEYAEYVGNYYGTSLKVIQDKLAVSLFLVPPSFEERSRRLHSRGTDSEETIQQRLATARREVKEIVNYDYIVVNDTVDQAVGEILAILIAEGCRKERRLDLIEGVNGL